MRRVIHFEIHASNAQRATEFYSKVFGWAITKWDGPIEYYLVSTGEGDGIDGAIVPRRGEAPATGAPVNAYVCTIAVESLDDAIAKVEQAGGAIVVPKNEIPGIGWLCYAIDTETNIFGMLEPKVSVDAS
jgi:predicted enzyme related to lactoylglutathione lyase